MKILLTIIGLSTMVCCWDIAPVFNDLPYHKGKDTNGIIKFCESGQSGRGVCRGDVPKSTRGKQMSLSTTAKGFCYLYGKNKSYCKCTDHKGWYDSRNLQDFYTFTCYDNGKECRSENCS